MAKNKKEPINCRLGTVGGEAVLEGVMMKGKSGIVAVATRREDKSIVVNLEKNESVRKKYKILNIPIIRGVVGMIESFILSFHVLNISAEAFGLEEGEPSKFEKWLDKHFGKNLMDFVMTIGSVLGVALALGLFVWLPAFLISLLDTGLGATDGNSVIGGWKTVLEGILKILIFVGYLAGVSLMKDIRRTFQYHGAEHKSIFCYESGEDLTVENVRRQQRFHPRCGTSFIFVILIISIAINSLPFVTWDNLVLRVITKLALLPIVVGLGFEFIMYAGKHENLLTRILSAPGLWMQRITTREPDDEQIECAIVALKSALPDDFPDFVPPTEENIAKAKAEEERLKAEEEAKEEENPIPSPDENE